MLEMLTTYQRQLRLVAIGIGLLLIVGLIVVVPVSTLKSGIRLSTPFVLGSLAALIASRAGVLNLAIEGKMLLGAFIAVAVLYRPGEEPLNPALGVLAATIAGGVLGLIFAILYLRIRINLIILALALNLFVANVTVFVMRVSYGSFGTLADPSVEGLPTIELPLIHNTPLGELFSGYNAIVYIGWFLVFAIWLLLQKTKFGRHIRAVGENKDAAETAGINVTRVQIFALTLSGLMAGLAGAFFSLGILSQFLENMTAGRGWIALTVALFALEKPLPALITSLFFGISEALALSLQNVPEIQLPPDILLLTPQIAAIGALVLVALRLRGSELLKRRQFVAQFGKELNNLKSAVIGKQE